MEIYFGGIRKGLASNLQVKLAYLWRKRLRIIKAKRLLKEKRDKQKALKRAAAESSRSGPPMFETDRRALKRQQELESLEMQKLS